MAIRNYRQAKRNREDSRKKRQQLKLERKLSKGVVPAPDAAAANIADAPATRADGETKELP